MSFPKKGKFFPRENGYDGNGGHQTSGCFADEIASALKRSLGDSRAGVKTVVAWTGANEKTVKNWFSFVPSYAKKKWVLSLTIGPPIVAPYWYRR